MNVCVTDSLGHSRGRRNNLKSGLDIWRPLKSTDCLPKLNNLWVIPLSFNLLLTNIYHNLHSLSQHSLSLINSRNDLPQIHLLHWHSFLLYCWKIHVYSVQLTVTMCLSVCKGDMTWRPSTVTHTWNFSSLFNPSKLVDSEHTHTPQICVHLKWIF